eukprot:CAMPEP_0195510304 /NCGR_PEP_ID=MMETSP0794_2-20130614/2985_1 /TAXON_ID=515487 /ORGANISM="Stephanopyxis turris, Strain CCMP 815" /LENGTH=358 /DNA_ID=CAMNT_0040637693 /DNA_START=292 /DNA_END=1368 /DNA_ORIENTATION=+
MILYGRYTILGGGTDEIGTVARNFQQKPITDSILDEEEYVAEETVEDIAVKPVKSEEQKSNGAIPPWQYPLSKFPTLKYGTAWKAEKTAEYVRQALHAGFRHIDTACQPKHYNEAGVGIGWTTAAKELGLSREDVWIQTKFTSVSGQDPNRIPYDKDAVLEDQVLQSLKKSLENLRTDYLDSYVMHGPENTWEETLRVWSVMESFVERGFVGQIGVSNAWDVDFVKFLFERAQIKPAVVQQRFHADTKFEVEMRKFCEMYGIEFQSFWTLGANRHALHSQPVVELARKKELTVEELMYAYCLSIGITPLDGTTNDAHMALDMALLKRFKDGERIFDDEKELAIMTTALGIEDGGAVYQ